jgi:hypothetical protein
MFKKIVPFAPKNFSGKKVRPVNTFEFAKGSHIASIMVNEYNRAAGIYPIVFLKDGEKYNSYVMMGLNQNENLFIDEEGHWKSGYIPAIIRRYPFVLAKTQQADNFMLGIDEESEFLSDTEGEDLLDSEGNPSKLVENAKQYLTELHKASLMTERFCKELADRELIGPLNLQIRSGNETMRNIGGCFGINEAKFNELPDEDFLELRKRGILPLIYAHILSLSQFERLVQMRSGK